MTTLTETRKDPITGQEFTVVLSHGHGRKQYATRAARDLAGRLAEIGNLIETLAQQGAWTREGVSGMRSRLFGFLNQGAFRSPPRAIQPRKMDLGPELWARISQGARARKEQPRVYVERSAALRTALEAIEPHTIAGDQLLAAASALSECGMGDLANLLLRAGEKAAWLPEGVQR